MKKVLEVVILIGKLISNKDELRKFENEMGV